MAVISIKLITKYNNQSVSYIFTLYINQKRGKNFLCEEILFYSINYKYSFQSFFRIFFINNQKWLFVCRFHIYDTEKFFNTVLYIFYIFFWFHVTMKFYFCSKLLRQKCWFFSRGFKEQCKDWFKSYCPLFYIKDVIWWLKKAIIYLFKWQFLEFDIAL